MGGLIELLVVFAAVIGWGVIELVALSLDKKRDQQKQEPESPPESQATDSRDPPPR